MRRSFLSFAFGLAALPAAAVHGQINIPAGNDGTVINNAAGEVIESDGSAISTASETTINNEGVINGAVNGVNFVNGAGSGTLNNSATGQVLSNSRAVNIGGQVSVINRGLIAGLGDQRNGTVYSDSSAQGFSIDNQAGGVIDAGAGNLGAGFSAELAADGTNFIINNRGVIQGRGNAPAGAPTAGDGIRLERTRNGGILDGTTTGLFNGVINNSGTIASEGANGTVGGFRAVNGVDFQGILNNQTGGVISGPQNGVYFGTGDHRGGVVTNAGTISSDSRALNIDGEGLTINNSGTILATGTQRNGTAYADSTAQNFLLNNTATGVIDAGAGLDGAAFSAELSAEGNNFSINNSGLLQGRGNAGAGATTAGDGIRLERARNGGVLDGTSTGRFLGSITNSGEILSEGANGTVGGFRAVNGVDFQGTLTNEEGGVIAGVQNGVYFGTGDHTGGVVDNAGLISSDSRALNIDGEGLTVNNSGTILATGTQRNGTTYADSTAQNFSLNNTATGVIDAGAGLEGAAFSAELSADGNDFSINNEGLLQGRGNAGAGATTAGDGIRLERARNGGVLDGTSTGRFLGNITNSGEILSEGANGTVGGFRAVNGVDFQGTLANEEGGVIAGVQNGVYFGTGDHLGGVVDNAGLISSDSRALNIDGEGLTIENSGTILATGTQRNGTAYADSTAQNFSLNNTATGVIDAGEGLEGAAFSAELSADGNDFSINNEGLLQGRGNAGAGATTAGDGIRLERARNGGVLDGTSTGRFLGNITNSGEILSEGANGTVGGFRAVNGVDFQGTLTNEEGGVIAGVQNGVYFGTGDHLGGVVDNAGLISSDSRALNIDGEGLTIENSGTILATGTQRNGTAYADSTAQNFSLNNTATGVIDAGEGLEGAAFSAELSADGNNFSINNEGLLQGRGNAGAGATTAGDGIRLERARNGGVLDGTSTGRFLGNITNSGEILSEGANGTVGGFRAVNGVDFQGTLTNEEGGVIAGVQNGVYFGTGDHTGGVVNNAGTISSDSRAVNIDGENLSVNNSGTIVATGTQRNGTVYADSTAQGFTLTNSGTGVIDAGEGLEGAAFSAELSAAGNDFTINNSGLLQGRGNAGAGATTAGDGIRLERARNGGVLDGTSTGRFLGSINNSGEILSEGANGTVGGFRAVNGVDFQGELNNQSGGVIAGAQNGVYFGTGDHTGGVVDNAGTISSDSRALNIDGQGLTVTNSGSILATGTQRNGTVYADSTAQDFTLNNTSSGVVDAGAGLEGAAFSAELSAEGNDFTINNSGLLQGRGNAGAGATTAGDGIRLERARNGGVLDGTSTGRFTGSINNSGQIVSEGANGTVGGFRAVNGVDFQGTLNNLEGGVISGVQNGVYFGTGDHTGGVVNNAGTVTSDSRAVNIDGDGLTVNNSGSILATGRQRNGTVYVDGTGDNFVLNNSGFIDATGGAGSGVSVQVGSFNGDIQTGSIINTGSIIGFDDVPDAGSVDAGVRLFSGAHETTFQGDIINGVGGVISANAAPAVLVEEGVEFEGTLINAGLIDGGAFLSSGDALLTSTSTLELEINDLLDFETFDVGGSLTLGGTLDLLFADSFVPLDGQVFDLFDFENVSGNFAEIRANGIEVDAGNLLVDGTISFADVSGFAATAVPEPGTAGVLGLGLLGMIFGRRRRRRS